MNQLFDNYGRRFSYLRLSVTDVCNFRCQYCLPNGYSGNPKGFLNLNEINNLLTAFTELGMRKVRLTGGEPTVRKDFLDIVKLCKSFPEIEQLALTTNGYKLKERVASYRDAGVTNLTISIDSLDKEKFFKTTGQKHLDKILEGVEYALSLGFKKVKINATYLADINDSDEDLEAFLLFIKNKLISVRFIELMQTGSNLEYFKKNHSDTIKINNYLLAHAWQERPREEFAGPAREFFHPNYAGSIGVIAPYSKDFCGNCNRLRISARGNLHLCLFTELAICLRTLMQSPQQKQELKQAILQQLPLKKESHYLHDGKTGVNVSFSTIGG